MRPSRQSAFNLALSLTLLFATNRTVAQTPTIAQPTSTMAAVPAIPITVTPKVILPSNGKLPASMALAVSESNCDAQSGTDLVQDTSAPYSLVVTGSGLALSSQSATRCKIMTTLTIDPNAAGPYTIFLIDKARKQVGSADLTVLDSSAGPIPPGLNPQVDVMWEVMSQNNCSDVFGKRVAQALYCIQLKIGNNSGHPIQIAGVGFTKTLKTLLALGVGQVTVANSSYASTRAVLLQSQVWSNRNLIANSLQGVGLVMAGFNPFFSGSHNLNPKLHFTTATAIVGGVALQAYNLIVPDPIIPQLKSLDDQSFRDNMVIQNNSHTQTVVFVEKQAVTTALREIGLELNQAFAVSPAQATQAKKEAEDTITNSTRPKLHKKNPNPLLVKLALGDVVIVGDEIEYLQRLQIQNSPAPSSLSPLTASPSSLTFADQMITQPSNPQTVTLTNTGSSAITNLNLELSGANKSEFGIPADKNTCASTLEPVKSCTAALTFTPDPAQSAAPGRSATLNVSFGPSATPQTIPLSGNAKTPDVPTVIFSQTTLPFGTQKAGSAQSTATLTIANFTAAALTNLAIASPTGTNAADFASPPDNKCTGTLAVGSNCSVTWTFRPPTGASGPRTAIVSVTYQVTGVAASASQAINLSGTAQ
jgi:hypothetical protein